MIRFPQRSGALLSFIQTVLGPTDDITHFQYSKKTNREEGPAIIGIEIQSRDDLKRLLKRMDEKGVIYSYLNNNLDLFHTLI